MATCIILAAGNSRRFGAPKMLHSLADGRPMLASTISRYSQVFEQVNVVVQPDALKVNQLVTEAGATPINSPQANRGMSQSLIAGINAHTDSERWLIALGDMPYILPSTIRSMLNDTHDIVAPAQDNLVGNPVIFSSVFKDQLLNLQGDRGGRSIIHTNSQKLGLVDVTDSGIFHDIDTLADVIS